MNNKNKYWYHDIDLTTSTGKMIRSVRPFVIFFAGTMCVSTLIYARINDKGRNPEKYSDPVMKYFVKTVFHNESHFYKYLDLIPVYEKTEK